MRCEVSERAITRERTTARLRKRGCRLLGMESHAVSECRFVALEGLTDAELLAGTRRLVGRSNQLLAELLAHLGEVEARGVHRTRACSSLYAYCIYELRFSED